MKTCTKCGVNKPLGAFSVRSNRPDGRKSACKACLNAAALVYNSTRKHVAAERSAKHYLVNRDTVLLRTTAWSAANKDKTAVYGADWRAANPETLRAKWSRRRALTRTTAVDAVSLLDVISRDGPGCYMCGVTTDPRAPVRSRFKAELEHEVSLAKGGSHTLDNLRCACHPCNLAKGAHRTADEIREMFQ